VTFKAMDPGYDDGLGSGVDYTEYVIGSSTSTPPAQSSTGIKGSEVTITDNAPTGPVYLWFRSVDKVGNREVWQKIFVYIDKPTSGAAGSAVTTGPVLTNDVPGWWINAGETPMNNCRTGTTTPTTLTGIRWLRTARSLDSWSTSTPRTTASTRSSPRSRTGPATRRP
jgi:hypothetical protein